MTMLSSIDNLIESKLLNLHTAYLATIISTNGTTAKIQPLNMFKQYGKAAEKLPAIPDVPILTHARWKTSCEKITYVSDISINTKQANGYITNISLDKITKTKDIAILQPLAEGDIVFCVCAERDISEAKNGNISVPTIGRHSLSDSVIVGVLK